MGNIDSGIQRVDKRCKSSLNFNYSLNRMRLRKLWRTNMSSNCMWIQKGSGVLLEPLNIFPPIIDYAAQPHHPSVDPPTIFLSGVIIVEIKLGKYGWIEQRRMGRL